MIWLVRTALVAIFPSSKDIPGVADCDVDAFLRQARHEMPLLMWTGVVLGSLLFVLTPMVTVFVPLPSFWLSPALLDKHAQRIASHRLYYIRQLIFLVKMIGGLCWGAHPTVRRRLGLAAYGEDPGTWRHP